MLEQFPRVVSSGGVVEVAVSVNALGSVFQSDVAENVVGVVVTVLPDERDNVPIIVCECVVANSSPVTAPNIVLGRPPGEIKRRIRHFLPLRLVLRAVP